MTPLEPLLEVTDLKVHFALKQGRFGKRTGAVRAVDGVTFSLRRGETLGLVGESGSGKTTVGRTILRAVTPTSGRITYRIDGRSYDLGELGGRELRSFRRHAQMIFQDPYASLDPRMTIRDVIAEPLVATRIMRGKAVDARVREIAVRCKLDIEHLRRFPHAFSGGQRQRIGIARALATHPAFIVCDEPVSALDVSIQAEILNLLEDLQEELGLTYLFIAHDLAVVAHIADRVAVMYVGEFMEFAATAELFSHPLHPYTEALLSAIPEVDPTKELDPIPLAGEIPNPADPPPGCRFHTRCRYVVDACRTRRPEWRMMGPGRWVACHRADELELQGVPITIASAGARAATQARSTGSVRPKHDP